MKGSIAAILGAAKALKENNIKLKGDLILSFVADEEHESIGAQALVKKVSVDAAIVTEPTDLDLCLAHRGFGIFKISTEGKTAHGGWHKQGIDANMHMGLLLAELHNLAARLPQEKSHPLLRIIATRTANFRRTKPVCLLQQMHHLCGTTHNSRRNQGTGYK